MKQDFEFIVDVPPDDYCIEKRLTGQASQMVCIVDKTGVKSVYPIMLS